MALLGTVVWGCGATGGGQRVRADHAPETEGPPNPLRVYSDLGYVVGEPRFAAVGRFVHLPGPGDSTYTVFALSLPNNALRFRREPPGYMARYRVAITVRDTADREADAPLARSVHTREVRVRSFRETSRSDESVIFQAYLRLPPGRYAAEVEVRDLASATGFIRATSLEVPRFDHGAVSAPVLAYRPYVRADASAPPEFIVNPRATVTMGTTSIPVYVEARPDTDAPPLVDVLADGVVIWTDTLTLRSRDSLAVAVDSLKGAVLPPGALTVRTRSPDASTTATSPLLVALSEDWLFADYQDMLGYLRYAGTPKQLERLREAAPGERAERILEFWQLRDPNPATPENEFFERYFRRIRDANNRFSAANVAGWLTDRGAVYVTLGPPDEVFRHLDAERGPGSSQIWLYNRSLGFDLRLVFIDEAGIGVYSLTGDSRRAFFEAVERVYSRADPTSG